MKTANIANKNAREFVEARQPFKGSNLYAERHRASHGHTDIYVVYSYGTHFPIYVAEADDNGEVHWYENAGRYSISTTKHQSQACPYNVKRMPMTTAMLRALVRDGIAGVAVGAVA